MENKFKIFVIVAIAVLALAIGASTFFMMKVANGSKEVVVVEQKEPELNLKSIALGESILTNITSENSNIQHFAKVQVSIGVDSTDEKAFTELSTEIEEKAQSIRSEVISTIGEQTYSMLSAANGKTKLADELITRLNTLLDTDLIYEVYYQEYFIQ